MRGEARGGNLLTAPSSTPDLHDLILGYLDGRLSAEQTAELDRLLSADPQARRLCARLWLQAIQLGQLGKEVAATDAAQSARRRPLPIVGSADAGASATAARTSGKRPRSQRTRQESSRRSTVRPTPGAFPWARWLSVAACLAIIAGAFFLNHRLAERTPAAIAELLMASPDATILRNSGGAEVVEPGAILCDQDAVRTPAGGSARLQFRIGDTFEATTMDLGAETTTRVWIEESAKRIQLSQGTLTCDVAHQPAGKALVILTPHAEATVVGTRFTLAVSTSGTRLAVTEGRVRLRRLVGADAIVEVIAGRFAVASADVALVASPVDAAAEHAPTPPGPEERRWRCILRVDYEGDEPGTVADGEGNRAFRVRGKDSRVEFGDPLLEEFRFTFRIRSSKTAVNILCKRSAEVLRFRKDGTPLPVDTPPDLKEWMKIQVIRTRDMVHGEDNLREGLDKLIAIVLVDAGQAWIDDVTLEVPEGVVQPNATNTPPAGP